MYDPRAYSQLNRREFMRSGGVAMAAAAVAGTALATPRGGATQDWRWWTVRGSTMWGRNLLQDCGDVVEIVGLCDINSKRAAASQKMIGINAPLFVDFDQMVITKPDRVVIATVDATHSLRHSRHGTGL